MRRQLDAGAARFVLCFCFVVRRRDLFALPARLDHGRVFLPLLLRGVIAPAPAARRRRRERSDRVPAGRAPSCVCGTLATHSRSGRLACAAFAVVTSLGLFAGGLLASPRVRFFRPPKATELFAYCQTQTRAHWLGIHCATMPQCWIVLGVIYASVSLERDASPGCGKRSRQSNAIRTSAGESC